jgi:transcriptional regulator with XRE-family HTH domain
MARGEIPTFPARLKQLREERQLTQVRLAELARTSPTTVAKMEMGQRLPTLELAWRLASALGVSVNDLLPSRRHPDVPPPARRPKAPGPAGGGSE